MAYPNRLRVAPSGTFANANTVFLNEIMGEAGSLSDNDESYPIKIGPEGNSDAPTAYLTKDGPLTAAVTAATNKIEFDSVGNKLLALSEGTYIIEVELCVGFDTLGVDTTGHYGALTVTAATVLDDLSQGPSVVLTADSPLARDIAGTTTGRTLHSTRYVGAIIVPPAAITNNDGQPISGLYLEITRLDGVGEGSWSAYDTTSGDLAISKDTNYTLRRLA